MKVVFSRSYVKITESILGLSKFCCLDFTRAGVRIVKVEGRMPDAGCRMPDAGQAGLGVPI